MGTKASTVLQTLSDTNGVVTIALEAGGLLIPLIKGAIQEIKQVATGGSTVTWQVLVQTDDAELDAIDKLSTDDLAAINAELARLGLPPVPGSNPPAPPAAKSGS